MTGGLELDDLPGPSQAKPFCDSVLLCLWTGSEGCWRCTCGWAVLAPPGWAGGAEGQLKVLQLAVLYQSVCFAPSPAWNEDGMVVG